MLAEQPVLVHFEGIQKSFGGQVVLEGVSGEICQGEVILLRGENGSGKTTLLNILTGCLEPEAGTIEFSSCLVLKEKTFRFPRAWYRDLNPFQRFTPENVARLGIGRTWQDVRLFQSLDLADNIAAASSNSDDSPWAALAHHSRNQETDRVNRLAASDTLAALGLVGRDGSSGDRISLGQSKRVAMARALQAKAKILFLDEPLSGLDADGIRDVIAYLRGLVSEHALTLIIIEHVLNIRHLLDLVTSVWTLENGGLIVSDASALASGLPQIQTDSPLCSLIKQAVGSAVPTTTQSLADGANLTTFWLAGSEPARASSLVLQIRGICMERGSRKLFCSRSAYSDGLTFELQQRTLNLLEAPNGWGKSSLADVLSGRSRISSGEIRYGRGPIAANAWTRAQSGILVLPSSNTLFPSLSIEETLKLMNQSSTNTAALREATRKRVGALSGGERQRLALEVFCSLPGSLFVFDEPLAQLDGAHSRHYAERMLSIALNHTVLVLNPGTTLNSKNSTPQPVAGVMLSS